MATEEVGYFTRKHILADPFVCHLIHVCGALSAMRHDPSGHFQLGG